MKKLILRQNQSPGDIVMLTCAVRDLHKTYPNEYLTDVKCSSRCVFDNNPYIKKLDEHDPEVRQIEMHYPAIHGCNQTYGHFAEAFTKYLSEQLKRPIKSHGLTGELYMSKKERVNPIGMPYWLIISGGKSDYTCKHYDPDRLQEVVDYFAGKIQFVQVGQSGNHGLTHFQPKLNGVIDKVNRTTLRELIHLTYHADGVICGITGLMHLAAAVPTLPEKPKKRAAVIYAGGREPQHWVNYDNQQTLHTLGMLDCCINPCWKSRVVPLGDGDKKDESLCKHPVTLESGRVIPQCMDLISACDVINAVEKYFDSGNWHYLEVKGAA